ncbi:SMP-30/gluconolactonase/LRE family protein [Nonomuraea deserti]|uniref:SMP-30/gluconolactonase/LRE family protein n=1 Tax=Nonomuraea deserti TaxID=1848322 RepID=UPI0014050283|nr:SMP-30/gluconolactonase/LRE family protein [Nonomuraea deserti]
MLLVALSLSSPAQADTAAAPPTECGFHTLDPLPLTGATTAGTALDAGHPQGARVYSVTSSASGPALLGIRDARDGRLIGERPLPLALGSWAVTVAPDHSVYVGSYNATAGAMGRLFRYDPDSDQVSELGIPIATETFVWTVAASPDGSSVYGGTSPTGRLFRYDTADGTTTDLGSPVPGEQFVRDLAVGPDGTVYAGVGAESMKVAVLAPGGTVERVIEPPVEGAGYAYDVAVTGPYLLVRFVTSAGANPMGVYDLRENAWKDVVEDVDNLTVGGGRLGHDLYLFQGGELARYDLKTEKITQLGLTDHGGGAARTLGWLGHTLVGTSSTGRIWHFDRETGQGRLLDGTLTGQPVSIRSLGAGPDGHVYAGGFFTGGLAAYDPATGETRNWPDVGQSEGIVTHKGKLYLGVYPGARIYEFDGSAPRLLLDLGAQEQDRPFAMISAGDWLAFGTVPKSGTLGGALGLLDPATGRTVIKRNIIPGHSVIGLAYRDGVVYGATSGFGGTSTPQGEGVAFAYDIATDSLKWRTVPVPGDLALGSIAFDDAGRLWGLTPDALFELDPATGRTVRTVKHQTYPWDTVTQVWLDTNLVFHKGFLWGKVQGKAYRIDPGTMAFTLIARPISNLLLGPNGHLYLSRFENFYTYRVC